ncbi:MAG: hypothetical protein WDN75_05835 [Bacteroidota bacterium]
MDKTTLVDKDIKEGKEIVETLDKVGLFFPIAMWFFMPNKNEWRLFFGKEDINYVGSRGYYKKIHKVLNKITPRPDITSNDISLISTENEIVKLIQAAIKTHKKKSGIRSKAISGRLLSDAYVYRAA